MLMNCTGAILTLELSLIFGKVYWGKPYETPIGLTAAQIPRNLSEDTHEEHGDEKAL
jgi:hypothetical protein